MTDIGTDLVIPDSVALGKTKYEVPKSVDALYALLERTKSSPFPLPFNASILVPEVRSMLYILGGIPLHVPPHYVVIFAGHPYVEANGAVDACIENGGNVWTDKNLSILACNSDEGAAAGCPQFRIIKGRNGQPDKRIEAQPGDKLYQATGHATKPSGGRYTDYGSCCIHTWAGQPQHRGAMARTRAKRRAALCAMGIPPEATLPDDDDRTVIGGDFIEGDPGDISETTSPPALSTDAQRRLFWKLARSIGPDLLLDRVERRHDVVMDEPNVEEILKELVLREYGHDSTKNLSAEEAHSLIELLQSWQPPATDDAVDPPYEESA